MEPKWDFFMMSFKYIILRPRRFGEWLYYHPQVKKLKKSSAFTSSSNERERESYFQNVVFSSIKKSS